MMLRKTRVLAAGVLMSSLLVLNTTAGADMFSWGKQDEAAKTEVVAASSVSAGSLPALTQLIKQNSAAVVNISVEGKSITETLMGGLPPGFPPELERFFRGMPDVGPERESRATGSGFILSADGYVVTNAHVVEDAKTVAVGLNDRRELKAEIVGVDKLSDIALLKVDAENLPTVTVGDSDNLEVGQWVFAIGAPFGLDHTATQGIVSALSRSLPDGTYVPFIQTDVAVNPGNSGGPLFDLNGRVVGVNSQIYSRSGGYMGISFAIPINVAQNVAEQLKTSGQVSRGWLGVEIQDMDQNLARSFNLDQPNGALVASVQPGSPADKGGLQAGDIITGFGKGKVNSASDLPLLVGNAPIGQEIPVSVLRKGKQQNVNVTIAKLASDDAKPQKLAANNDKAALGVAVSSLSADELEGRKLESGVLIERVLANSPAEKAGLEAGDVIVSVNSKPISSVEELKSLVDAAPNDKPLAMLIKQGGQTRFIAVKKS